MGDLTTTNPIDTFMAATDTAGMRGALELGDAATKDVGTSTGTVAAGDDERLSDARTPLTHTHDTSDINGLDGTLAGLGVELAELSSALAEKADIGHTHAKSDVIGFEDDLTSIGNQLASKADLDHTHDAATTSAAGFMSGSDKTKLNGIATGANNYTLPAPTTTVIGGVKRNTGTAGQFVTGIASDGALLFDTPAGGGGGGGIPNVRVRAHKNGTDQSISGTGAYVTISFGTEDEDTAGDFASDALTVSSGEVWMVVLQVLLTVATNNTNCVLSAYKNGSLFRSLGVVGSYASQSDTSRSIILTEAGSYTFRLNVPNGVGQTIEGDASATYLHAELLKS